MTAATTLSLRLSTVRDCPLRAVFEATGADAREPSERERRIMFSGRVIGSTFLDMLEAGGTGPIEREVKIPWAHGIGHADGWVPETRTLLEVLSSSSATDAAIDSKLVQLCLYMEHKQECTNGALLIVDPRDYSDERVILTKGSPEYDKLLTVAVERLDAIDAWVATGDMPVCAGQANSWFCRFDQCPCKQPKEAPEEIDLPEARETVLAFAQAKDAEKQAQAALDLAKERRMNVQAVLEGLGLPVGTVKIGSYELQRIHYAGRRTFNLWLAEKDSRIPDELLADFVKQGEPYEVFKVKKVDLEPSLTGDDFGKEVPF